LFLVVVTLVVQSANAQDKYHVDVREQTLYPGYRTYDIDVRRTGLRRLNFGGPPVEKRLIDSQVSGRLLQHLSAQSQSKRDKAEANLLNAQAELLRFQLREAKKQSRQRKESVADVAAALIFAILNNVDLETASNRYLRNGGDPKILSAALVDITHRVREIQVRDSKAKAKRPRIRPLPSPPTLQERFIYQLDFSPHEAETATKKVREFQRRYKLTARTAIRKFLTLRCNLTRKEASVALARMGY
jgi:hypothetical protein